VPLAKPQPGVNRRPAGTHLADGLLRPLVPVQTLGSGHESRLAGTTCLAGPYPLLQVRGAQVCPA